MPFIKEHGIALALGIAGLVCLGFGLLTRSQSSSDIVNNPQLSQQDSLEIRRPISPIAKQIIFDIEDAVEKPGFTHCRQTAGFRMP